MKRDRAKMAHSSHSLIREAVRAILREETVSVFRKGEESLYDVDFDDAKGEIVGGRKMDHSEMYTGEVVDAMKIASTFTSVDKASLLNKLTSYYIDQGMEIRSPVGTGREAAAILNQYWTDTINWPSKKGKGPGEVAMHLAFDSNPKIKEPDFVSADGSLRISVKYIGPTGDDTVLSGTSSTGLAEAVGELKAALRIKDFSKEKWGEKQMYKALMAIPAEERLDVIDLVRDILGRIKEACVREHDAQGVMFVTDSDFAYVNAGQALSRINPVYLAYTGTRVEFTEGDRQGRTSIERGIQKAEEETRTGAPAPEPAPKKGRGKKTETPPEAPPV